MCLDNKDDDELKLLSFPLLVCLENQQGTSMKVASISISIVILANMVALSVAQPQCCPNPGDICSDNGNCGGNPSQFCTDATNGVCCNNPGLCTPPPPPAASASAPAPVDNTPFVFPFTEQAFTSAEASALVFDKQQELSDNNAGGLRNFATVQGDLFVDPTITANNAVSSVVTNTAAFGTPTVGTPAAGQFLGLRNVPVDTTSLFGGNPNFLVITPANSFP
jgi:hypothetical protein